jgi:predicted nucleic acid-binding protein
VVIVYIESNFVLEIALEQEQSSAAHAILSLAENCLIALAYPSFVLSEPFEAIMRARRERNTTQKSLEKVLNDLRRSEPYKQIVLDLMPAINVLAYAHVRQINLLYATFGQLARVGRCIHIDEATFGEASMYQSSLGFSPQDGIIYSAMLADLKKQPEQETKCFLSRDRKAFGNDDYRSIRAELETYNCRYISSFTQALDFIQDSLKLE